MRAFGYVRLSKDREGTTSPQRQRQAIDKLCAERGWELVETFEDIDVSAFNGKHRPGYTRMMSRLAEADVLVFWKLDRLTRSTVEAGHVASACKAAGVNLVATDMDIDTSTAGGEFIYDVLAAAAKMESGRISERSKSMHGYKRERGEWVGRPPFGWEVVGRHLERNEEQQAILRDVARRYIDGESLNSIGKSHGMLATVLARILYSDRVQEALPDDLSGPLAEAIVARRYHQTGPARQTLLGGIATCGMCGGRMAMSSSRGNRKQGRWYTLRCRETGHVTIAGPWLENYVTEQVLEAIDSDRLQEAIKRRRKTGKTRKASEIEARLELLDTQYVEGKVSKARFDRMNGALLEQLKAAHETERQRGIDLPAELARNLSARWPDLSIEGRRRIIGAVLERIEVAKAKGHGPVDPSRVTLVWRD
jgi:DNA invertase Pin-like site-specific DNA recombinase